MHDAQSSAKQTAEAIRIVCFMEGRSNITFELTGRGVYIQPSIQSIKVRKRLPALRSNDLCGGGLG
jgi:predicted RNA-binding protein YlxR (DUF448 family)